MTSKELHTQKIVPLRLELQRLEEQYEELFRKECGEKVGGMANCDNCAYSCVLDVDDHNGCMGGSCTCCHDWCYRWIPENEVSAFLRKNYHYDEHKFYQLRDLFGYDFLNKCDSPQRVEMIMEMLKLSAKFSGKLKEEA